MSFSVRWYTFLLSFCYLSSIQFSQAQQTARMTSGGTGYLEKLPPDYSTNPTRRYPVLFFLHGSGETGNGSPSDLNKVKAHGPPFLIENGHNMCFTVNGVEECFIVISPQLGNQGGWWPSVLNDVFNYVISGPQNYRIDLSRVYLTGLSLGGWGVYIGAGDPAVADIFAAAAPVSGFANGNGCSISSRKIPMWGFHGTNDGTIPYSDGLSAFNSTVYCSSPAPSAELKWTSYAGQGHNIWENFAFRTDNNLHTPNLYQWLLTKSKSNLPKVVITNPSPVCSPATVNIAAPAVTAGSTPGMTFTYWADASATIAYSTPTTATHGIYYIKGTVAAGSDIKSVTVTVNPTPTVVITNPSSICPTATVDLTSSSVTVGSTPSIAFTYWINSAATQPYNSPAAATVGTYFIKGTTTAGCFDIKSVTVSAKASPTVLVTNPSPVCPGSTSNLTSSSITAGSTPGLIFSYWTNSSTTSSLSNPTSVEPGTYYIKGINSFGCFDVKPVTISLHESPNLIINNPLAVCSPAAVDITLPSITSGSSSNLTLTYWLDALATISLSNPFSVGEGIYFIKATNASGCFAIKSVAVTAIALPVVAVTNPAMVCFPSTIDLTAPAINNGSSSGLVFTYWENSSATTPLSSPEAVSSGTYYIKGTNALGCANVKSVTTVVNPQPVIAVTNPAPICPSHFTDLTAPSITTGSSLNLTFTYWHDPGATVPLLNPQLSPYGIYYIHGINSLGCSDIKSVVVDSYSSPNLVITNPPAVCSPNTIDLTSETITIGSSENLMFEYWQDGMSTIPLANPTACSNGTYFIEATNIHNCSVTKPVKVTVNDTPTLAVSNPAAVCAPATIDLTKESVVNYSVDLSYTYWFNDLATASLSNPHSVTSGIYFIKATNSDGCSDIKPVNVIVNDLPNPVVTNPVPVCAPATIDLTSTTITAGSPTDLTFSYWLNKEATVAISNPSSVSNGAYYIKATDVNGCEQLKLVDALVYEQPLTSSTFSNATICSNNTVTIQLTTQNNISSKFNWTAKVTSGKVQGLSDGVTTSNSVLQTLSTDNMGGAAQYSIQAISLVGNCLGTIIDKSVTVKPVPVASINPFTNLSVICNGCNTNIVLQNSNNVAGTTFSWTSTALAGIVTGNSSGAGQTISQVLTKSSTTGTVRYTVSPKAGTCEGNPINYDVRINNPPICNAGGNLLITLPANSAILNGSGIDSDGSIASYAWSRISGPASFTIADDATANATVSNLIEGTYQFRLLVVDNDGAIGLNTMTLVVKPKTNLPPVVSVGSDIVLTLPTNQVIIRGNAVDSDGSIKSTDWVQTNGPKVNMQITGTELLLTNLDQGIYSFRFSATDNNNATTHADINVEVLIDPSLSSFLPAKFITPNGDNANDLWVLDPNVIRYASCKLVIFSSAGEKIFEAMGYKNNWDGTHDGKPLPQDVYYYVCECSSSKKTGSITIIR
jgi:gliding motility-associated-like protein